MNIGGKKKEQSQLPELIKKVGLFEAKVVAINPTAEEYKELLGVDLKEDSKATEYLGTSQDGNTTLRLDVWLQNVKNGDKLKVTFFIEDKEKVNKDGNKQQYINSIGSTTWCDSENNLPEWFVAREYRKAYVGEDDLYNFLRTWLGNLDYRDAETTLQLDLKKLMKGNVKDLKDQIDGEWCTNIIALATVKTAIRDNETKEYQSVYNKAFLPTYAIKHFRLVDFSNPSIVESLRKKKSKDLKPHERFVINVHGDYGCKDYYILKDLKEYNPEENLVSSDKAMTSDGADY